MRIRRAPQPLSWRSSEPSATRQFPPERQHAPQIRARDHDARPHAPGARRHIPKDRLVIPCVRRRAPGSTARALTRIGRAPDDSAQQHRNETVQPPDKGARTLRETTAPEPKTARTTAQGGGSPHQGTIPLPEDGVIRATARAHPASAGAHRRSRHADPFMR